MQLLEWRVRSVWSEPYRPSVKRRGSSRKVRALLPQKGDGCWVGQKPQMATPIRLLLRQFPALKAYKLLPKKGRKGRGKRRLRCIYKSYLHLNYQTSFPPSDFLCYRTFTKIIRIMKNKDLCEKFLFSL